MNNRLGWVIARVTKALPVLWCPEDVGCLNPSTHRAFSRCLRDCRRNSEGKGSGLGHRPPLKVPQLLVGLLSAGDPQPPPVSPHLWGRGSPPSRPLHLWGCDSPQSHDWAPPGPFSCGVVTVPRLVTGPLCLWGHDSPQTHHLWGCDNLQTPSSMGQQQPPGS